MMTTLSVVPPGGVIGTVTSIWPLAGIICVSMSFAVPGLSPIATVYFKPASVALST